VTSDKDDKNDPFHDFGSPENEMRARQAVKAEKKQYDENVARAREASDLASEIVRAYEAKKAFNSEDAKKFERLEKLAKRIRNEAGGSDSEPDVKNIPGVMDAAVKQVAEMADDLRKLVEKTPRHVISAAVIDQANKLLGLLEHVRFAR
jgi:predicted  nucleic acid-binding Zn-ribbon protein